MPRWLLNRRVVTAVVVLVAVIVLMTLTARERQRVSAVERWTVDLLAPVQEQVHQGVAAVRETTRRLAELNRLRRENARLRAELAEYRRKEAVFDRAVAAYTRVRALLALKQRVGVPTVAANVIGRAPDRWLQSVIIDVGARDGVRPDMVVVEPRGLVGRITRVTERTATVMLLTDPQSGVGVRTSRGDEAGVALGDPRRSPGHLTVRFFARDPDVRPGDALVTSGYGRVFPPGLEVGDVTAVRRSDRELTVSAVVRTAVDFDHLPEVLVLRVESRAPPPAREPEGEP